MRCEGHADVDVPEATSIKGGGSQGSGAIWVARAERTSVQSSGNHHVMRCDS